MSIEELKLELKRLQREEQKKPFGKWDDERYETLSRAIDVADQLTYTLSLPTAELVEKKGRLVSQWTRLNRLISKLPEYYSPLQWHRRLTDMFHLLAALGR